MFIRVIINIESEVHEMEDLRDLWTVTSEEVYGSEQYAEHEQEEF